MSSNGEGHVFAIADTLGILRSTDQGTTWTLHATNFIDRFFRSIAINRSGIIVVGTLHGRVYRSADNGQTWMAVATLPERDCRVALAGRQGEFYITATQRIYKSTDEGIHWAWMDSNQYPIGTLTAGTIRPDGFPHFGGDGGQTLVPAPEGGWYAGDVLPYNTPGTYISSMLTTPFGYMFLSSPYGIQRAGGDWIGWEHHRTISRNASVSVLTVDTSGRLFAGTRGFSGVFESRDAGESWQGFSSGMDDKDVTSMVSTKNGFLFAGSSTGSIYRTTQPTPISLGPIPVTPGDASYNLATNVQLRWRHTIPRSMYSVEFNVEGNGGEPRHYYVPVGEDTSVSVTVDTLRYLAWRIWAHVGTDSANSVVRSLYTGPLSPPAMIDPPDFSTEVKVDQKFTWHRVPVASYYAFRVFQRSNGVMIASEYTTDTVAIAPGLVPGVEYDWTLVSYSSRTNSESAPAPSRRFITASVASVAKSEGSSKIGEGLSIWPNPFNSESQIEIRVPQSGRYRLTLYDRLGRTVKSLWNGHFDSGSHRVTLAADGLSSGQYYVILEGLALRSAVSVILIK
jgi:hypothetical protein